MEDLPCSKKCTCYCQAAWQKQKAKLARPAEEKAELMERLKDTEMHLGVAEGGTGFLQGPRERRREEVRAVGWLDGGPHYP